MDDSLCSFVWLITNERKPHNLAQVLQCHCHVPFPVFLLFKLFDPIIMAKPLKCDLCDNQATVHLTQIVNNQIHKVDLCESCAEAKGITDPNGYSLADLLVKPPVNEEAPEVGTLQCSDCGYTQREFKKTGRVGCPSCYNTFSGLISPALESMHKGESHRGKVPQKAFERRSFEDRLSELELALKSAIEEEQYENAAKFRDEIIELKKNLAAQEAE